MGSLQSFAHPTVLVVDDEPLLRSFNTDLLADAGFDVIEAVDADEALRVLERPNHISVVLTDVEMPGSLDGFALAARIGAEWPGIGVVVTSGRRLPNESFTTPARCFVPKPYSVPHLLAMIESVLHSSH